MLTVKELKEKLANVPDDAIVVTQHMYNNLYYAKNGTSVDYVKPTLDGLRAECFRQSYDDDSLTVVKIY